MTFFNSRLGLSKIRALREKEGRSIDRIVSELLAEALAQRKRPGEAPCLTWVSQPMHALVDLSDKAALSMILDSEET
jgi:hypothetical protein